MSKSLSPLAAASALLSLTCVGAGPAQALSLVTFVSGKGTDSGNCASPASPCRSFQFAIGQTNPGGEVKALDPAHYGGMVITKSISITGVEGASINRVSGDAITINAGPNDKVNITGLTLDGAPAGQTGVLVKSGGSFMMTHCTVRNFVNDGILLQPTGTTNFLIANVVVSDNSNHGILVYPQGAGSADGTLDHVSMYKNFSDGIFVDGLVTSGQADVTSVDSIAARNGIGFTAQKGTLRLARSTATENFIGAQVSIKGTIESFGDNHIHGNYQINGDDVSALTRVGTQ